MVNELAIAKYIRLSSEDLDVDGGQKEESVSVTAQRQLISAFISEHTEFSGFPIKEFVDDGFSGTNFDRPAFQRMMEEAKQGRFSIITHTSHTLNCSKSLFCATFNPQNSYTGCAMPLAAANDRCRYPGRAETA